MKMSGGTKSSHHTADVASDNDPFIRLQKSLSLSGHIILPDNKAEYDIERSTFALNYCYLPSLIIVMCIHQ